MRIRPAWIPPRSRPSRVGCTNARRWPSARWTWRATPRPGGRNVTYVGRVSRKIARAARPALLLLAACVSAAPAATQISSATFFATRLPPGLPAPLVPADNPISEEKVQLGRRLFYDTRLSANGSYSCASCHQQARAFTDGRAQAVGSTGQTHTRSSLSLTNVAYNATYGWADDKRQSLESQMEVPMYNEHPIELGLKAGDLTVLTRLSTQPDDVARFRAAF